jgi:biotin transport system substrate-specific component
MTKPKTKLTIGRMSRIAVMAALLCVASPWSIPAGPIPISLATLVVYLTGIVLGWLDGTIAVAVYLLIGAIGVPVFAGPAGGIQKLIGVTGGYLLRYLPCVALTGLFADLFPYKRGWTIVGMVAGTIVLYAIGTVWFMIQSQRGLVDSLTLCVLPFLPGDAAKIAVCVLVGVPLRRSTDKLIGKTA